MDLWRWTFKFLVVQLRNGLMDLFFLRKKRYSVTSRLGLKVLQLGLKAKHNEIYANLSIYIKIQCFCVLY